MEIRPTEIRLIVSSLGADWPDYLQTCLALLRESAFWPIRKWEVPARGLAGDGPPDAAAGQIFEDAELDPSTYTMLTVADHTSVTLQPVPLARGQGFSLRLSRDVTADDTDESLLAVLADAAELARGLAARTEAVWAKLIPAAGGATCIPAPPLVEHNSHLVLTTDREVEEEYDMPEAFWDSGWDSIERFGERRLLLRGMDAVGGPEYLRIIFRQQWLLARIAKPERTAYFLPQPYPSETGIFHSGLEQLHFVGYDPTEQLVEYSCAMSRGERIPGWQIYELWDLVQEGALSDGRPVKSVRVVFFEQSAALQEKRPLLDIGCRVFHEEAGELRELTE